MVRILLLFLRRLWLPLVVFAGFSLMCVLVYRRLEGLNWQDALFWMIQPHAIDAKRVHNSTKLFYFYLLRRVCVSDLGSRTCGGYNLQPAGIGGLENYGERSQHRETARSLHNLRLRAGRPYGGGSAEPPENSFCVDRDQRRIVPRTA